MRTNNAKINFLLILLVGAILSALVLGYEVIELNEQIEERDYLIDAIQKADKSRAEKIDEYVKEIKKDLIFTHDTTLINIDELLDMSNHGMQIFNSLNDSLNYYKTNYKHTLNSYQQDSMFNVNVKGLSMDSAISLLRISNKTINNLRLEHSKQTLTMNMYKAGSRKYNIHYIDTVLDVTKDSVSFSYKIDAPQLDSALILLPYYRKELKYDKREKQWVINIKRWF